LIQTPWFAQLDRVEVCVRGGRRVAHDGSEQHFVGRAVHSAIPELERVRGTLRDEALPAFD
jgi:hypothetical protein